ncbi:MAG: MFS transporter [Clostridiales bacterium]|jgi:predicted MFS family arabinose efflux permease|nr:MFS transporter [Clostridiales bacterium]
MNNTNHIEMSKLRLVIAMLVMGAGWAIVYLVPFLQYTWYEPFKEFLGTSGTKMSFLLSIYGLGNIFLAPIGGWIADKFNYKIIYFISIILNAIFAVGFLLNPQSYIWCILMWIGFAVASLMFNFPTQIKIVRMMWPDNAQGRAFGWQETCIGIFNIVESSLMMLAFQWAGGGGAGIKATVVANIVMSIIIAAAVYFVIPNPTKEMLDANRAEAAAKKAEKKNANVLTDVWSVLKHKETWMFAFCIFGVYSFMTTLTYFTPYFSDVLGVPVVIAGWAAIFRQYGCQMIGAPIGGEIATRLKSPAKNLVIVYICAIAGLIYMLAPKGDNVSVGFVIFIVIFLSFACYAGRNYYATIEECGIPAAVTATTTGAAAILGFSPDIFQFTLFSHWLDSLPAATAYNRMFVFQLIVCTIGLIDALLIIRLKKKNQERLAEGKEVAYFDK